MTYKILRSSLFLFTTLVMVLTFTNAMAAKSADATVITVSANDKGPQQTVGEYFDDATITTAVKGNILAEKGLSSFEISVKTTDGIVTLTGVTNSAKNSELAARVAKQTDGVRRVINNLTVK